MHVIIPQRISKKFRALTPLIGGYLQAHRALLQGQISVRNEILFGQARPHFSTVFRAWMMDIEHLVRAAESHTLDPDDRKYPDAQKVW